MSLRRPKTTVRWRLTLIYGGLFLVSGAALLAITYTLVSHATVGNAQFTHLAKVVATAPPVPAGAGQSGGPIQARVGGNAKVPPLAIQRLLRSKPGRFAITVVGSNQRISDLHQLIIESAIALAIMALLSTALGWVVAGRVLRPLRTITATAQQISEANLHRRLAMEGPPDELRQLADTIDGLLERLEGAFDAQRRFVANASHELRTPLTAARAMLEMVISDPHATVDTFRDTCEQVLEEGEQQEQLIDALLTLAQGQRGLERRERVDLAAVVGDVVQAHRAEASTRGLELEVALEPAAVSGDARLIERLASNLVQNALRHNEPGGRVEVRVAPGDGTATLRVVNTGPRVPAEEIGRLLAPFQRLAPDRISDGDGLGLGLSIVAAIASAHDALLDLRPRDGGGLEVSVQFALAARASEPPAEHHEFGSAADHASTSVLLGSEQA